MQTNLLPDSPLMTYLSNSFFAALGAIALHLWRRYRNRLAVLRWSASYTTVGVSGKDPTLGEVQIIHNGRPIPNLTYCSLQIENESNEDLTDVEICLGFADGTIFLSGNGQVHGAPRTLLLTEAYANAIKGILTLPLDERPKHKDYNYIVQSRDYLVPVLNRDSKIDCSFFIQPSSLQRPVLVVCCEHKGVVVKEKPARPLLFGVYQKTAIISGFMMALILLFVANYCISNIPVLSTTSFFLGFFSTIIGVGVLKARRIVVKVLS